MPVNISTEVIEQGIHLVPSNSCSPVKRQLALVRQILNPSDDGLGGKRGQVCH